VPIVLKSGNLSLLEPSRPVQACTGKALPLPLPLGSVVTGYVGAPQNVKARIKKANGIFVEFYPLWKNKNGKSVLLYGWETWEVTTQITSKLQTFVIRVCEK